DHCFIEANVCEGGCAKGPESAHWNTSYVKTKVKIENGVSYKAARDLPDITAEELHKEFKDCSLSDAMPSEEQIRHILKSNGKYCAEDELNCGACG
ncbi:histidine kinase, partial [[Ruminococcus] torques]|nr:histidine kinase [[Ruminococcus] torques]